MDLRLVFERRVCIRQQKLSNSATDQRVNFQLIQKPLKRQLNDAIVKLAPILTLVLNIHFESFGAEENDKQTIQPLML